MVLVDVEEVLIEKMTGDCMIDVPEVLVEERAEEDNNVARLSCEISENVDGCVDDVTGVLVEDEKTSMVKEVGRELFLKEVRFKVMEGTIDNQRTQQQG